MPAASGFDVRRLASTETGLLVQLRAVFREAFEDDETYGGDPPAPGYLEELLSGDSFIAIVAVDGARVVGGIAAYELRKLERRRSEIYLYDLAVLSSYRRQGIATALIRQLQRIAQARGAHVVFVQADLGDEPAIALYTKLGVREDVLHFDLLDDSERLLTEEHHARLDRLSQ